MAMYEISYYKYITREGETPEWMRSERYAYCEPFFDGSFTGRHSRKRSLIHSLLSALALF